MAVDGNDRDSGTKGKPFRTLERAREAIGKLKEAGANAGCTAWLRGDAYYRSNTFELFYNANRMQLARRPNEAWALAHRDE